MTLLIYRFLNKNIIQSVSERVSYNVGTQVPRVVNYIYESYEPNNKRQLYLSFSG